MITIQHRGQQHEARLTRVEYFPDGRIQCAAKKTQAASYVSTAQGSDPLTIGQSLVPLRGSTSGYLMDIPRIRSEQDVPGMTYGMEGIASGWPGGVLLRSDDAGNSYQSIGSISSRARVFIAGAALSSHHGYSVDSGSVLTVTPAYSAHTLASVTDDQLYAHTNLAAYGADGRWEIVAFKTVTDNTGSYAVKDFLRGLYGTEQYPARTYQAIISFPLILPPCHFLAFPRTQLAPVVYIVLLPRAPQLIAPLMSVILTKASISSRCRQ